MASRGDDFALSSQHLPNPREYNNLFTQLACLNLCFNRKLLLIPRSTPTFKLAIMIWLEGDVSLNPRPAVRRSIRLATTNVRSIRDKTAPLSDLLISKAMDILAVTETWLRPHDTAACIADMSPSGYTFHHRPRSRDKEVKRRSD